MGRISKCSFKRSQWCLSRYLSSIVTDLIICVVLHLLSCGPALLWLAIYTAHELQLQKQIPPASPVLHLHLVLQEGFYWRKKVYVIWSSNSLYLLAIALVFEWRPLSEWVSKTKNILHNPRISYHITSIHASMYKLAKPMVFVLAPTLFSFAFVSTNGFRHVWVVEYILHVIM